MKYSIGILTISALFAAFILSGCDNRSNKMDSAEISVMEANRNLDISKSEVEAELRIYRTENAVRIMEYNRTISRIKQRIENESDLEARVRLEKKLKEHEATHRVLKREMDNYRVSGRENWKDFKDNFSSKMDDLGNSLDNFFSTSRTTTTASSPRN